MQERCIQLYEWFSSLNVEAVARLTRQLYAKPLSALAEGESFESVCKVVTMTPIRQDFVAPRFPTDA